MKRRFRRRLKSKWRRKQRRKHGDVESDSSQDIRQKDRSEGKEINSLSEAIDAYMPSHLRYLLTTSNSPVRKDRLEKLKWSKEGIIKVPSNFSILSNSEETYLFLRRIVSVLVYQSCRVIHIDYGCCSSFDLPTQIFFDSILKDYFSFSRKCVGHAGGKYINVKRIHGQDINDLKLQKMIHSVGSPVVLKGEGKKYTDIVPFRLRHIDGAVDDDKKAIQKEIDSTALIEYVMSCLNKFGRQLDESSKLNLGYIVGETVANAEEHSSLHNRYLIGYMEEQDKGGTHAGVLNLVIMNTGMTIYECFKNPGEREMFNDDCLNKMKLLSDKFTKKRLFDTSAFTEENLWTLYTLQEGVSIIKNKKSPRGHGTIEFIDSFFKLKGSSDVDKVSHLSIISGCTRIDFDGTYKIRRDIDNSGVARITFNESGSIEDLPDEKYVYRTDNYFPGTIIYTQLLLT